MTGTIERTRELPSVFQMSLLDILNPEEFRKVCEMIIDIQDRNPDQNVRITFETQERSFEHE